LARKIPQKEIGPYCNVYQTSNERKKGTEEDKCVDPMEKSEEKKIRI